MHLKSVPRSCSRPLLIPTKTKVAVDNGSAQAWREQRQLGPWPCLCPGQSSHCSSSNPANTLGWNLAGWRPQCRSAYSLCTCVRGGTSSVVWCQAASNQGMHAGEKVKPAQQGSLKPLGLGCIRMRWGKLPSDMGETQHSQACSSPSDPDPTANRVAMVTEHRERLSSCLALALTPSPPASSHTKVTAASRPWGRLNPTHCRSSCPSKAHWAEPTA